MSETAKWFRGGWLLLPLLLIVLALAFMPGRKQNELSYQQFKQVLESGMWVPWSFTRMSRHRPVRCVLPTARVRFM